MGAGFFFHPDPEPWKKISVFFFMKKKNNFENFDQKIDQIVEKTVKKNIKKSKNVQICNKTKLWWI